MKKIIVLILAVTSLAAFYFYSKENSPKVSVPRPSLVSANKKLFLGKRQKVLTTQVDNCFDITTNLSNLDLNLPVDEFMASIDFEALKRCDRKEWQERIKSISECSKKNKQECQMHVFFLRSILRTEGIKEGFDQETLADLITREFSTKNPNFKNILKHASALLDRDPSNHNFQKLWAMSKLMSQDKLDKLPEGFAETVYKRLDPEIRDSQSLRSMRFLMDTRLDPVLGQSYAENLVNTYPKDSDTYELLGWTLWKQGKRDEAIAQLETAMRLNPDDMWLPKMYKDIKDPNAKMDAYQARMHLSFRLEDLFN